MMTNDNIKVVRQDQIVVTWIRLRQMKTLKKEAKPNSQLTSVKNSKLLLIKILVIIKIMKMVLMIKAIRTTITIITIIIIKCRGR